MTELRDRDLRAINIDSLIERVVAQELLQYVDPENIPRAATLDELQIRKNLQAADRRYRDNLTNVRQARVGRPRIPYETLVKVAEVYRENIDGRPTEAVQAAFGLSRRTAARYVQSCRSEEHKLLPPTEPRQEEGLANG
ncbi:MAG: hypothetical protein QOC88_3590 [Mycobacterium sp.]|nr:hypothetical protein [Mycobacterium sp.]MDT5166696.1 hypothetical protein [Mycobacterium sp.]